MSLVCTRCQGTGFLNLSQITDSIDLDDTEAILAWIETHDEHDVSVCDCCGNAEEWYGTPGEHYNSEDQPGPSGPYQYNGGLCECH